jgi:nicotinate-nucleotide adenylyltransferase
MKIGLFFGSFNPIHTGHMVIANYMAEFTDLKQIWFVVSPSNPLKDKASLLPEHHRLQITKRAIEDFPKFKASDIEFKLPQPSYTIVSLTYLKEKYPKNDFALIIGGDNLRTFHKWKNHEQILEQFELYVYPRPKEDLSEWRDHPSVKIVNAPLMDISSSFIREGIKSGKDLQFFLPPGAAEYIAEMNFYKK